MAKNIQFSFINNYEWTDINEIKIRDQLRLCTMRNFDSYGIPFFICQNKAKPFLFFVVPMIQPQFLWIDEAMLCDQCLDKLSKKYNIDFRYKAAHLIKWKNWSIENFKNIKSSLMIKSINEEIENIKYSKVFTDPELYWWNQNKSLIGLPNFWFNKLKLKSIILSNSSNQGKYNGPDYIFKNIKTNEIIGLEIVSWKWNLFDSFKKEEEVKKYAKKNIFNSKSIDDEINELKKILEKKANKKYLKCDELYLGIVVTNTIADYQYYVYEIILNEYNQKINSIFKKIFIL